MIRKSMIMKVRKVRAMLKIVGPRSTTSARIIQIALYRVCSMFVGFARPVSRPDFDFWSDSGDF